jgi:Cof subfamily protein (haloacid dehalogenase superfamily)
MQKNYPTTIKALALDLDGTSLLPDTSMGDRTIQCLKKLIASGIQVIFSTGRAVAACQCYYDAIGAKGPMVFCNGALVVDVPEIKLISSNLLGLEVIDYAVDLARNMDVHYQALVPPQNKLTDGNEKVQWDSLLIEKQRPESEMYQKHTGIVPIVTDIKKAVAATEQKGAIKTMFIAEPAILVEVRKKMLDRFGNRIYITGSYPTFLEIMNAGVSKGEGLKTVMECRGLKPEEVMAFGDEENDLPMFNVAGFSAAPSGAKDKVREAADFVFGPIANEGLASFLDDLFENYV